MKTKMFFLLIFFTSAVSVFFSFGSEGKMTSRSGKRKKKGLRRSKCWSDRVKSGKRAGKVRD